MSLSFLIAKLDTAGVYVRRHNVGVATTADVQGLLGYRELYELWERQQWRGEGPDLPPDRIPPHQRLPTERPRAPRARPGGVLPRVRGRTPPPRPRPPP